MQSRRSVIIKNDTVQNFTSVPSMTQYSLFSSIQKIYQRTPVTRAVLQNSLMINTLVFGFTSVTILLQASFNQYFSADSASFSLSLSMMCMNLICVLSMMILLGHHFLVEKTLTTVTNKELKNPERANPGCLEHIDVKIATFFSDSLSYIKHRGLISAISMIPSTNGITWPWLCLADGEYILRGTLPFSVCSADRTEMIGKNLVTIQHIPYLSVTHQ